MLVSPEHHFFLLTLIILKDFHLKVDHLLGYHGGCAGVPHAVHHTPVARPQLADLLKVLLGLEFAQLLFLGKEQL